MSLALLRVGTDEPDLRRLAHFLARVFRRPELYAPAYLRWLYRDNPAGRVIGMNAWHQGALVGHYALVPFESEGDSGRRRAALAVNVAVDPGHQGRGLFTRLARETSALASDGGVGEILVVANANSTPGFVRRLGFRVCGPLEARLLWRRPGWRDPEPTASWRRVWSAEALRWRGANPQSRYTREEHGELRALLAPTGWRGIRALLRLEPRAAAAALPDLPTSARPPLWLWLGRGGGLRLRAAGQLPVPLRLRPSPLNLLHCSLSASLPTPDPVRMRFEACDFDAY